MPPPLPQLSLPPLLPLLLPPPADFFRRRLCQFRRCVSVKARRGKSPLPLGADVKRAMRRVNPHEKPAAFALKKTSGTLDKHQRACQSTPQHASMAHGPGTALTTKRFICLCPSGHPFMTTCGGQLEPNRTRETFTILLQHLNRK